MQVHHKSIAAVLAVLAIVFSGSSYAQSSTTCTGTITGTHASVIVNSSATVCTLSSATVTGNVTVSNGGRLTMSGTSQVLGNIEGSGAGVMQLNSGTVLGAVNLMNSGALTVGTAAVLSSLNTIGSGVHTLRGRIENVNITTGSSIALTGAIIAAGVNVNSGLAGGLTACGANITGGITMTGTAGGLSIGIGTGCAVNTINGTVFVSGGTGAVRISNANMLSSDVIVTGRAGNVILTNLALSYVLVENLTGAVTMTGVATDSDSKFISVSSTVSLSGSVFNGDIEISTTQAVNLTGNDFGQEDLTISKGTGAMTISGNINMGGANISERGNFTFSNNRFAAATFSKNGAMSITGNIGGSLDCVDNVPAPTGSNNNITFKTGQCSNL